MILPGLAKKMLIKFCNPEEVNKMYRKKTTTEARILNGSELKDNIFKKIKDDITDLKMRYKKVPGIAFIAVLGHEPLMKYTIALHDQAARELGFNVIIETRPNNVSEEELFELVNKLNQNNTVHSIVLLQPLPEHLDAIRIISKIDPDKEVEGFHPHHIESMLRKGIQKTKYPMVLPTALTELFKNCDVQIHSDAEWVFVVDDEFFKRPFTNMVVKTACIRVVPDDSSCTIVNHDSQKLAEYINRADYLFIITKKPGFLQPEWLKPGVCIVDVYSNLIREVPSKKDPNILLPVIRGGVFVDRVKNIAGAISPCPGGLMPIVLAVLLRNSLISFKESFKK